MATEADFVKKARIKSLWKVGFALLAAASLVALVKTADAADVRPDTSGCPAETGWTESKPSIVSLELAGDATRFAAIADCWGLKDESTPFDFREKLDADRPFIGAYVVFLVLWCLYGAKRAWSRSVRHAGAVLAGAAVIAGVLDLLENCYLAKAVAADGVHPSFARDVTMFSVPKWGLATAAAVYAIGSIGILVGRVYTWAVGGAFEGMWEAFVPPDKVPGGLANPMEPRRDRVRRLRKSEKSVEDDLHATMLSQRIGSVTPHRPFERQYKLPNGRQPEGQPDFGIGLSGGGIRAASYCLGAMQVLEEESLDANGPSLVANADFLASVSGGGYFAVGQQALRHGSEQTKASIPPEAFAAGTPEMERLRAGHRYLWDNDDLRDTVKGSAVVVGGIGFNICILLTLIVAAAWPVGWVMRAGLLTGAPTTAFTAGHRSGFLILVVLGTALSLIHAVATTGRRLDRAPQFGLNGGLCTAGFVALLWGLEAEICGCKVFSAGGVGIAAVAGIVGIGVSFWLAAKAPSRVTTGLGLAAPGAALGTVAAVLGGFIVRVSAEHGLIARMGKEPSSLLGVGVLLKAAAIAALVVVALGFIFVQVTRFWFDGRAFKKELLRTGITAVVTVGVVVASVFICLATWRTKADEESFVIATVVALGLAYALLDQKRWSPHVFYKKRLSTVFGVARLQDDELTVGGEAFTSAQEIPFSLRTSASQWLAQPTNRPQLIVVAVAHSSNPTLPRKERAWPFEFASDYVGGPNIGWTRTIDFEASLGLTNGGDGTALAAMAISGAAIASSLGVMSKGSTNALLALSNSRLGVWLPSPAYVDQLTTPDKTVTWVRWRRLGYLLKELVGHFDVQDRFVYVSDGGHIENLGLLSLLRRHCKLIVLFDASGDKCSNPDDGSAAGTLRTSLEQAAWRLGVSFQDDHGEPLLTKRKANDNFNALVRPLAPEADRLSRKDHIAFSVRYPKTDDGPNATGRIILVKSLVTKGNRRRKVIKDALEHRLGFPRTSTADQWLTDVLFEGYVALGRANAAAAVDTIRTELKAAKAR